MLNLNDILQLVILCAIIFFALGYATHRHFPHWRQRWQNLWLPPRYLKSADVGARGSSSSQKERRDNVERDKTDAKR